MEQNENDLQNSPWVSFDMKIWKPLISNMKPVRYKKNQFVFQQEQPAQFVYIIGTGRVRITSFHLDGTEKQYYIAECGCMIGETSCFLCHNHATFAVAIVDSDIYCVPFEMLKEEMKKNWELSMQVMQVTCRKNNTLLQQVTELSFAQALQRISQALVNLGHEYGKPVNGGLKINIKFTHQDVANLTTASRVTVSNVFNTLADRNLIIKQDGYFVLLDTKKLEAYARGNLTLE